MKSYAIEPPLLDNNHIRGAKKFITNCFGSEEVTFQETDEISSFILTKNDQGGSPADIIMGVTEDEDLESSINVTAVAIGFYEGLESANRNSWVVHDLRLRLKLYKKSIKKRRSLRMCRYRY